MDYEGATTMSKKQVVKKTVSENFAEARQFGINLRLAIEQFSPAKGQTKPPVQLPARPAWLASLLGVSRVTATKWLNGVYVPLDEKKPRVADLLNVQLTWLFFNFGPMRESGIQVDDVNKAVNEAVLEVCNVLSDTVKAQLAVAISDRLFRHR